MGFWHLFSQVEKPVWNCHLPPAPFRLWQPLLPVAPGLTSCSTPCAHGQRYSPPVLSAHQLGHASRTTCSPPASWRPLNTLLVLWLFRMIHFTSQTSDHYIIQMPSNESGLRSIQETQPWGEETGLGPGVSSNSQDWGPWAEPKWVSWTLGQGWERPQGRLGRARCPFLGLQFQHARVASC